MMELKDIFTAPGSRNLTISRTCRRKKKCLHNSDQRKNHDSAMDKNPFIQKTYVRWERILGRIPHRSNYPLTGYHERLAGGADKDGAGGNRIASHSGTDKVASNGSSARLRTPSIREGQVSSHNYSRGISDKNVDDMIDCAIKNLQEAGKALVTLGENHEHELKLMVMDILTKFQKWIDVVQKKMDAAKYDVNSIRKAHAAQTIVLTAKDRELAALQAKLAECEAERATYKKPLNENQSNIVMRQSTSRDATDSHPNAPISALHPSGMSSHHLPSRATVQLGALGSGLGVAVRQLSSVAELPVLNDEGAASHQTTISFSAPLEDGQNMTSANGINKPTNASSSWVAIARKLSRGQIHVPDNTEKIPSLSQIETHRNELPSDSVLTLQPIDKLQQRADQSQGPGVPIEKRPVSRPSVNPPVTSAGTMTSGAAVPSAPLHVSTAAPLTSDREGDQEDDGRVVQLEAELMQLRSENERMKRDHAEYENSIQRALLQGVSSLNAEALKVLKNPPFICYKPCEPCNLSQLPSPAVIAEDVSCVLRAPNNHMSQRRGRGSSPKIGSICYTHDDCVHSSLRKQAASVCYAPAKKSSQNSMLLLLPQQHIDCACTAVLQEYCVGTNYERAGRLCPRDRSYCAPRVTAGREGLRGGPTKTHTRTVDRCEPPCNRNRRFITD